MSKCLFLGFCEGTKAYRLMFLQTKKIIKYRDVKFLEDSTSMGGDSKIHKSGRNERLNVVIVDESPKRKHNDECKEIVGDIVAQNGGPTLNDGTDEDVGEPPQPHAMHYGNRTNVCEVMRTLSDGNGENFGKDGRYLLREWRPRGEWWKNHIIPRHEQERANVALVDDLLNLCEAMRSEDVSKWEIAMQEEYDSLGANETWELSTLPEGRRSVGCK